MSMRIRVKAGAALAIFTVGAMLAGPVAAQSAAGAANYPNKPIKLIAPFAAGGVADVMARLVGDKLSKSMGTPVIVENRPGAGGNIGADVVAKAEPDGYTLLMASAGIVSINGSLYPKLSFDPVNGFAPVSLVADMPMVVVVSSSVRAKTLSEFIQYAKENEDKVFFSSPGNGTTGHLGMELFQRAANIKITHVPYKSGAESVGAVVSGTLAGSVDNPPSVIPQMKSGKVQILAVAAKQRLPQLPDVPTASEAGLPGFEVSSWFGIVAPAKTPQAIIDRLSAETAKALNEPDVVQRLAALGVRGVGNQPAEFDTFIKSERVKWDGLVKRANIRLE
ncbi:MAG: extra-cytoplasmic solute receptor [Herminiimonas sp.]|nr:extra-cytoplasmic solute receptor [Herminiimonas sp.]